MIADTHVHLLAGRDDGPPSRAEAVAMARMLVAEGAGFAAALAHQNPHYPDNTADQLVDAAALLAEDLEREGVPLRTFPTGEVMLTPDTLADFDAGRLLTVGGHGQFLLVEMPHGMFLDVRNLAEQFRGRGVRLVIAHAERYPELTDDPWLAEEFVAAGCLLQVTADVFARPEYPGQGKALKDWAQRGLVHLLGSDGHGTARRPPRLADGYAVLRRWAGPAAERAATEWGPAILRGRPVDVPAPAARRQRGWLARWFGG